MNTDDLLSRAENGLKSLNLSEKYTDSALKWLGNWLTDTSFKDYVAQIGHLIKTENWNTLIHFPSSIINL